MLLCFSYFRAESPLRAAEKKAATTAIITDNIFTDVTIMDTAESRIVEKQDYFKNNNQVKITLNFKFTDKDYQVGDVYETTLPLGVINVKDLEGSLNETASFKIEANTRKVKIIIEKAVQAAEYRIELTTKIGFLETADAHQSLTFETINPLTYQLNVYRDSSDGDGTIAF